MKSAIEEALREETSIIGFASVMSAAVGSELSGRLSAQGKMNAQNALRSSFTQTFSVSTSDTHRETKTRTLEYTIDADKFGISARVVAANAYKCHAWDLYLAFVDYLVVEYTRSAFGMVLKRRKLPEVGNSLIHPNVIRFGVPLASIQYWKLLPNASVMDEKEYSLEVDDPLDVQIKPLDRKMPFATVQPKPTLYQLAENAFKPRQLSFPF